MSHVTWALLCGASQTEGLSASEVPRTCRIRQQPQGLGSGVPHAISGARVLAEHVPSSKRAHDSSRPVCPCATFPRWHTFTGTDRSLSAVDTWYLTSLSNSRIPSWLCGHSPVVIVLTLHVTFKHRHHALPCPRSGSHRGGSALHCPTLYSPS